MIGRCGLGGMEDGRMKTVVKTWLVLALGIGMAGMASAGDGWVDEPLRWETKEKPAAAVNRTKKTVSGGEKRWIICPRPGEKRVEKGAEEQAQPDAPEQPEVPEPEAPAKKTPRKGGGEETLRIVDGTLKVLNNFAWLVRLLIH